MSLWPDGDNAFLVSLFTFFSFSTAALAWAFVLGRKKWNEELGVRRVSFKTLILAPLGIVCLGPMSSFIAISIRSLLEIESEGTLDVIHQTVLAHPAPLMFLAFAIFPGLGEELFFRGLVQGSVRPAQRAIIISACLFALIHVDVEQAAGVLALGFYLSWLRYQTGSIIPSIVAHIANNSVALIAAYSLAGDTFEKAREEISLTGFVVALIGVSMTLWCALAIRHETRSAALFAFEQGNQEFDG